MTECEIVSHILADVLKMVANVLCSTKHNQLNEGVKRGSSCR